MTPLATWIMKGPQNALGFVAFTAIFSALIGEVGILTSAALTLVWLQMGPQQGARLAGVILPIALAAAVILHSPVPLMVLIITIAGITSLQRYRQWRFTLMVLTATTLAMLLFALSLPDSVFEATINTLQEGINAFLEQMPEAREAGLSAELVTRNLLLGIVGSLALVYSFLGMVLGRSWQARLYNPGGFQREFHQVRLGRFDVALCLLAILATSMADGFITWVGMALFPLLVAGTALFHCLAKHMGMPGFGYGLYYAMLLLAGLFRFMVVLLAVLDTLLDIRQRLAR